MATKHTWSGGPVRVTDRREGDGDVCIACGLQRHWSMSAERWIYASGHPKSGRPCVPDGSLPERAVRALQGGLPWTDEDEALADGGIRPRDEMIASLRARLAEAERQLAREVARDDDITRLHRTLIAERDAAIARAEAAEREADRLRWLLDSVAKTHGCGDHIKNRIRMEVRQSPTDEWSPYRLRQERDEARRDLGVERAAREKAEAAAAELLEGLQLYATHRDVGAPPPFDKKCPYPLAPCDCGLSERFRAPDPGSALLAELARLHALEAEVKLSRAVCWRIAEGLDTTITGEEQDALILTGANELNNLLLRQESAHADVLAELVRQRATRAASRRRILGCAGEALADFEMEARDLREALATYGMHSPDCARTSRVACDCGLAEALDAARGST